MAASKFLNSSAFAVASGIHKKKNSFFLTVNLSAGQVSVMAYLPGGYNLGWPDKSAELYKRMVKKLGAT